MCDYFFLCVRACIVCVRRVVCVCVLLWWQNRYQCLRRVATRPGFPSMDDINRNFTSEIGSDWLTTFSTYHPLPVHRRSFKLTMSLYLQSASDDVHLPGAVYLRPGPDIRLVRFTGRMFALERAQEAASSGRIERPYTLPFLVEWHARFSRATRYSGQLNGPLTWPPSTQVSATSAVAPLPLPSPMQLLYLWASWPPCPVNLFFLFSSRGKPYDT